MKNHTSKNHFVTLFYTLAIGLLLGLTPSTGSAADAVRIAKASDLPGKGQTGACLPFARELFSRLDGENVPAFLVVFHWENLQVNGSGNHAIVVFKDNSGRYLAMDNKSWKPVWVRGTSPAEWVASFSGMDHDTSVKTSLASNAAGGRYFASR